MASTPFVAEIMAVPYNFAPKGWATCDGQLMPIAQNTALFSLLGVTYGGDGRVTFGLPNLNGRMPLQPGQGPGLTPRDMGEQGGVASVTLAPAELPAHSHVVKAADAASTATPGATVMPAVSSAGNVYRAPGTATAMAPQAVSSVGGNAPHENRQPYLGLTFIIALQGIYPPRS